MTQELTGHKVNPANDVLGVRALDDPGPGGASHAYNIDGFNYFTNPSKITSLPLGLNILFQNGPLAEAGVNGITHEALLAILIDRLQGFQSGPFASEHNAKALAALELAQAVLQQRTRERMARGVEGTHQQ